MVNTTLTGLNTFSPNLETTSIYTQMGRIIPQQIGDVAAYSWLAKKLNHIDNIPLESSCCDNHDL